MASPQVALSVGMTEVEIRVLRLCHQSLITDINPLKVSSTLCERYPRYLSDHSMLCDLMRHKERSDVTKIFLAELEKKIRLQDFVDALYACGYKKQATEVFSTWLANTEVIKQINRTHSGQGTQLGNLVYDLKKMVDNADCKDPRLVLSQRRQESILKFHQEDDLQKKQLLAEQYFAIAGAEIDAKAITYDEGLHRDPCFDEMKQLIKQTSKPFLLEGVYYGRLANAHAIAGRFEDCDDFLQEARSRANFVAPCIELLFIILFEVQVRIFRLEKNPSKEERRSLLLWARMGLGCTENTDLDSACKNSWRQSLILRMAFSLLGLGYRGNVIENCPVDNCDIQEAKELLADIDKHWEGIGTRRKMFYYIARSRIAELTGELSDRNDNMQLAIEMAKKGRFGELKYLTN